MRPAELAPGRQAASSTPPWPFCHCREQNTSFRCRYFVLAGVVSSSHHVHSRLVFSILESIGSGVNAHAPPLGYPGRESQLHGHYRSICAPARAPLGAALFLSYRPRYRVGLRSAARQHARRQRQRYVHRVVRSAVGGRWIFGESAAGAFGTRGLPGTTRGTGPRHGSHRFLCARTAANLPRINQQAFASSARARISGLTVYSPA